MTKEEKFKLINSNSSPLRMLSVSTNTYYILIAWWIVGALSYVINESSTTFGLCIILGILLCFETWRRRQLMKAAKEICAIFDAVEKAGGIIKLETEDDK